MTPPAEASAMQLLLFSIIKGAGVFACRPRRFLYHVSPDLFALLLSSFCTLAARTV